jgi:lysozyme
VQARNANNARGIDVSHHQGAIAWPQVRKAGISFAFLKATEGRSFVDDRFAQNVKEAQAAGVIIGAYHFFRAAAPEQAIAEADHYVETIGQAGGTQVFGLPFALDLETPEGGTRSAIVTAARTFIARFKEKTGEDMILYTYPSFINEYLNHSLADLPLWYARYDVAQPEDRGGWQRWMFVQHTDKGQVPGISGPVDMNEFDGMEEELMQLKAKYLLKPEDANKVIGLLSEAYRATADKEAKAEFHRLANELRIASRQPIK